MDYKRLKQSLLNHCSGPAIYVPELAQLRLKVWHEEICRQEKERLIARLERLGIKLPDTNTIQKQTLLL